MFTLRFLTRSKCTFEGQHSYEHVLALLHRHWFVIAARAVLFLVLALMPFVAYGTASRWILSAQLADVYWFLSAVYLCSWWYGLFKAITMYLLDVWIVTDHRVIDSEQHGFFSRTVSELTLAKIQDISVTVRGWLPTLLGFGDLEIQTAGTKSKFLFKEIPDPYAMKDLIMRAHNDYVAQHLDDVEVHEARL